MPHSAVVKSDRDTTKVGLAYDASSKGKGKRSLNECLMSEEPTLNLKILDVISGFRKQKYAFNKDIERAFLNIGID
ncbi:hypothetical protein NPIL_449371 [Nephila pilipes]|uniref:Uncharacterized protein n=1 Tax=Nephila pilipes TaxID=299642 RepID=A0A8X6MWI8_NEPPI|nr:hypothetical protein NPIL_449371 [Nephila pilipes]